jgi:hypothetical protein
MMNEFKNSEASGYCGEFLPSKKNIFKIIYDFIPVSIIIFVLGLTLGVWMANVFHNQKIVDSIKLQRFLHKTIVYNITPNIEINK